MNNYYEVKRYGIPYKGSKNSIAEWVYSLLPKRTNFYDLFAGGCAITQIALMRGEYKRYFCNDIDDSGIRLFLNAIHGKYKDEKRWISREDFFMLKDKDPYIKYCWSFGNNGRDYLYSKEIEPYKKAWHYAIYFNDFSFAKELNIDLSEIKELKDTYARYLKSKRIIENTVTDYVLTKGHTLVRQQQLENLNRLICLERLQSLQSLQSFQSCYTNVEILPDSVIYCDIPYSETNSYGNNADNHNFNRKDFYAWCEQQTEPLFISEYTMPAESFICIAEMEKPVTLCSGADKRSIEKVFVPKHQYQMLKEKGYIKPQYKQQSLFDEELLCG